MSSGQVPRESTKLLPGHNGSSGYSATSYPAGSLAAQAAAIAGVGNSSNTRPPPHPASAAATANASVAAAAAAIALGAPSASPNAPRPHFGLAPAPRAAPSAAQLAAAAAMIGTTAPTHLSTHKEDTDGYEVSDSEMEDSVVLRDGRRFPNALKEKHVSVWQLLGIVYFCVVGGPYGLEDAIYAGGLSWVLLLLVILPWTLNLPIGLLTSELASAMPQNGGYILWVARAFGNFWGFLEGWFSWSSGLFDTALYPFLIVAYANNFLVSFCGLAPLGWWELYLSRIGIGVAVMMCNMLNVQMQGTISLIFACATLLPFLIMTLIGLPTALTDYKPLFTSFFPIEEVSWGLMLSAVLWVGSGWDSPGTVAGDVKTPKKTYPRAVSGAVFLVMLTNLLPVLVAFSVEKRQDAYVSGNAFWAGIAQKLGGNWLQLSVIIVGVLGNLNMLHVLLTSSSWSLYALALPGLLDVPALTKLQGHFRTPWVCILINTAGLLLCCLATFAQLIQITMALNGLALILQCMALVWLRISAPRMKRPYRIPLGTGAVAAFMGIPILLSILLLCTIDRTPQLIVLALSLLGVVLFLLARLVERVLQTDSGLRPAIVDLQGVFEDVVESVPDSKPDDSFPDLGFRSSALVEQLPESIRSDPTEVNDNFTDLDHNDARAAEEESAARAKGEDDEDEEEEARENERANAHALGGGSGDFSSASFQSDPSHHSHHSSLHHGVSDLASSTIPEEGETPLTASTNGAGSSGSGSGSGGTRQGYGATDL